MFTQTVNKTKIHFDETLIEVQKSPVQITKNGKPVAVMMSIEEFESSEKMKLQQLQKHAKIAEDEHKAGKTAAGESFFEQLLAD